MVELSNSYLRPLIVGNDKCCSLRVLRVGEDQCWMRDDVMNQKFTYTGINFTNPSNPKLESK